MELLTKLDALPAGELANVVQAAAEMAPDHPEWTLEEALQAGYDELTYQATPEELGED